MRLLAIAAALVCPPTLPTAHGSSQLVTVRAPAYESTTGALELWQRSGRCWRRVAGPWSAHLGANGIATAKREGDGKTPAGTFPIGATVYGLAADPGVHGTYHRLVCGDWWDGDSASPTYNSFRHIPCGSEPPFRGASEALWRISPEYRYFAEIRSNVPAAPGRGSAIFLHVSTGGPTAGCVSLPEAQLVRVLRWLRPSAAPRVYIGIS